MKKLMLLAIVAILGILPAAARDRISYNVADLPQAAQTMLKNYFGGTKVNHIKIDKSVLGGVDYDVVLSNGCEVEFDSKGNWTEVDCGAKGVPAKLLPQAITKYVSQNYKGQKIAKVDVKHNKYEVELLNGIELEFDRAGNFLRVDR